jgi:hypothetical protein
MRNVNGEGEHRATGTAEGWFFRQGEAVSGPVALPDLRRLAEQARMEPDTDVSSDGKAWRPAKSVPELKMVWIAYREDGTTYGPFNMLAAPHLVRRGLIHVGTAIRKTVWGITTARSSGRPAAAHADDTAEAPPATPPDDGTSAAIAALAAPWVDDVDLFQTISQLSEACRRKALALRDAERERDQEQARRAALERAATEREAAFKQRVAELDAGYREAIDATRRLHEHLELRDREFKALEQSSRQIQLELDRRIDALERRLDERMHTSAELKRRLRQERAQREEVEDRERQAIQNLRSHIRDLENQEPVDGRPAPALFGWKRHYQEQLDETKEQLEAERGRHEDTWQWSLEKEHAMGKRIVELERQAHELQARLEAVPPAPATPTPGKRDAWSVRLAGGAVYGPVPLSELLEWTVQCRVAADHEVSHDGAAWTKARDLKELGMDWTVLLDDGSSYGPLNLLTIHQLMRDGVIPLNARLTKRPAAAHD